MTNVKQTPYPSPARRLTIAQDAETGGYYLSEVKIGRRFAMAPADLYKAEVYRAAVPSIETWDADDFDAVVVQDETAGTLEIIATAKADA
jgi:hypothetical protein